MSAVTRNDRIWIVQWMELLSLFLAAGFADLQIADFALVDIPVIAAAAEVANPLDYCAL